jgi:gamma-glutamyltranspeptidase / glutathione hydrolase
VVDSPNRRQFIERTAALVAGGLTPFARAGGSTSKGIVNGQRDAAAAGIAVLNAGGNAVDAAVAAALVAGVVAVHSTGIGGYGGHMLIARAGEKPRAIDFNSVAPAAFKSDMFPLDEKGKVKDQVNHYGWLAAGVPGVLAGLQLALDKFGSKSFAELAKPAIAFARDGFIVSRDLAARLKSASARFAKDLGSAKLYLPSGKPLAEGQRLRNPALADLLQSLAEQGGVDAFYRGDIAQKIAAAFRKNGGLVTADDLAAYRAVEVEPLAIDWQGCTIYTPPPTSGGLTVLQTIAAMKAMSWTAMDPNGFSRIHARVEAQRLAWSDRLKFLGDPNHANLPVARLLSDGYAQETADKAAASSKAKKPIDARGDGRSANGTIHLNVVDGSGTMVALTFTHGNAFGSQVTVDGLGLTLGHGMSRFEPRPGHPNSPAPGKRPLHNMCPTIVMRDGQPILALGATGGRLIPNTVLDVLAYRLGEGRSLSDAVKGPRLHTEGNLELKMEASWPTAAVERFKQSGYTIKTGPAANLSAIERDAASGTLLAAVR